MRHILILLVALSLTACASGVRFKWQHPQLTQRQLVMDRAACKNAGMMGQQAHASVYANIYRGQVMFANCMVAKGYTKLWAHQGDANYYGGACCITQTKGISK